MLFVRYQNNFLPRNSKPQNAKSSETALRSEKYNNVCILYPLTREICLANLIVLRSNEVKSMLTDGFITKMMSWEQRGVLFLLVIRLSHMLSLIQIICNPPTLFTFLARWLIIFTPCWMRNYIRACFSVQKIKLDIAPLHLIITNNNTLACLVNTCRK